MASGQQSAWEELRRELTDIRDRLTTAGDAVALDELRSDLDRIIHRLGQETSALDTGDSALRRFERLQPIDTAISRFTRRWQEVRGALGSAAAVEIITAADLYAGWRDSWGDALIEEAWLKRTEVEREMIGARGGDVYQRQLLDQPATQVRLDAWRRSAPGGDNLLLVLDLRYGASLSLAQIAELLGLSPAAVQMRINVFEGSVLEAAARNVIERQLPVGWQIAAPRRGQMGDLVLRRSPRQSGTPDIVLEIRHVRSDRDGAGRPRKMGQLRRPENLPGLLIVVFVEDGRVVFVPMSMVTALREPIALSTGQLTDIAREQGFAVLGDAIEAELAGFVGSEGG